MSRRISLLLASVTLALATAAGLGLSVAGGATSSATTTKTFNSTGAEQTFKVPAGVTSLDVVAVGGRGGVGVGGVPGGLGAVATAALPVTPGQVLFVEVGGNGTTPLGGFNGGGDGGFAGIPGGGGGGMTDIQTLPKAEDEDFESSLILAGGGGGGGGIGVGVFGGVGGQAGGFILPNGTGGANDGAPGGSSCSGAGGAGGQDGEGFPGEGSHGQSASNSSNGSGGGGGAGSIGGGRGQAGQGSGPGGTCFAGTGGGGGAGGHTSFGLTANDRTINPDTTGVPLVRITYSVGGGNKSGLKYGKVKLNKNKGTALLPVTVPGSGNLSVGGKGVVHKRPGLLRIARLAKAVDTAGTYKLLVKAKGKNKTKLFDTGKVKVKAVVTFKPTSGDAVHDTRRITLKKN